MSDLWLILPGLVAAGLAGSGHCFGMCGGLAALAGSTDKRIYVLWLNLARIGSYVLIGLLGGLVIQIGIGSSEQLLRLEKLGSISRALSGLLLMLLGLSIAGWRWDVTVFKKISQRFWATLQPLSQRLLPIRNVRDALQFGALWGWLPCGLVYAVLPAAWLRGNALESGLMMLAFGLGTLPSMLAMGMASAQIRLFLQRRGFRWFTAVLLLFAGAALVAMSVIAWTSGASMHHHH